MPISISGSRPPVVTKTPSPGGPVPVPYPTVAQKVEDAGTHGDSDSFKPQKDLVRLQSHGTDPTSHGELQTIKFPEPVRGGKK